MKKVTVTIGIPAYNEGRNIFFLIMKLLSQKTDGFLLKNIIVIDGNSKDNTWNEINKIKNKKIIGFRYTTAISENIALNKIFSLSRTDLVVLCESDTMPKDNYYISRLVNMKLANQYLGVIQGEATPLPPRTFIGNVLFHQNIIYRSLTKHLKPSWYASGRGGRLFSKSVYKKMIWPKDVSDDLFVYLWCLKNKISFSRNLKAHSYYQMPQNLVDLIKEAEKNKAAKKSVEKHFASDLVREFFQSRTFRIAIKLKMFAHFFIKHPFLCLNYLGMQLYIMTFSNKTKFILYKNATNSTKLLNLPNNYFFSEYKI